MSLQDYDGRTALHLAFAENPINFLLECGCSGNITDRFIFSKSLNEKDLVCYTSLDLFGINKLSLLATLKLSQ